jgi:hypothetical protein
MTPQEEIADWLVWQELLKARSVPGANQAVLGPAEHRAYARAEVGDKPWMLPAMLAMPVGYNALKAVGVLKGRSPASLEAVGQGMAGALEGFGSGMKRRF